MKKERMRDAAGTSDELACGGMGEREGERRDCLTIIIGRSLHHARCSMLARAHSIQSESSRAIENQLVLEPPTGKLALDNVAHDFVVYCHRKVN